ncbi:hypothetical protein ABEB36_004644 [Hypothenemus hampei]|uniref:Uncharacterized protein n=1 Tax=Hypothenemus hampei TaxID=57062 RepID=A0ABD1F3Z9_HYPHA
MCTICKSCFRCSWGHIRHFWTNWVLDEYEVASLSDNSFSEISSECIKNFIANITCFELQVVKLQNGLIMTAKAADTCDSSSDESATIIDVEDGESFSDVISTF